ncbi:rRNA bioproteinsis protein rrp36 [Rhodotorula toruloides]
MPAGILKKAASSRNTAREAPPSASPSSGSPSEDEFDDSEEDEWAAARQAGPSRPAFQQDDEDMYGDEMEDDENGVAAYESDQGELMEEEDNPEEAIGKELASIPFTSLLKAQKQLNKGNQKGKGKERATEDEGDVRRTGKKGGKDGKGKMREDDHHRSNKHAPTEMSTKKPVSRVRQVVETHELKARDPRFDPLSGSVNKHFFKKSYSFLADQQKAELETMRKTAAAARKNRALPQEEKDKIEEALKRMENREVTRRTKEREEEALQQWKKDEADKRREGKRAFYLKDTEKKKLFLKAKFDELAQDKRKLHKAMDKKRRKTAQKEKKLMPKTRPGAGY